MASKVLNCIGSLTLGLDGAVKDSDLDEEIPEVEKLATLIMNLLQSVNYTMEQGDMKGPKTTSLTLGKL